MIWIQICFCSLLIMAALVAWTIHRIKNRRPIHRARVEHRNPGERAWDDPDQKIAAPQYAVVIKLLTFVLAIVGIIGFGLGFYISAQSNKQATTEEVAIEVTEEFLETQTPTPEQTFTATITPTLFVEIEPTVTLTPTPTDDLTVTPYPTYTALPTYTPYPTLESVVERIIIVTPINQQPTVQPTIIRSTTGSGSWVVPDQRGQVQQQPQTYYQQPQYIYPTPQFIIPSWDSYITSTPVPTSTQRPTLGACPVYVESMFMTPTPSAAWCYTATPTPTDRVIIITSEPIIITNTPLPSATLTLTPAPTQTPYVIVVTAIPTITPEPIATDIPTETPMPTFTPEPPATQTSIPTATDVPTETPMPTFTPEPTVTPDEESTHEPTDDN
jgi:hypothetical protein